MPDACHSLPRPPAPGGSGRARPHSADGRLSSGKPCVWSEADLPRTWVCLASMALQFPFPGATQVGGKSGRTGKPGKVLPEGNKWRRTAEGGSTGGGESWKVLEPDVLGPVRFPEALSLQDCAQRACSGDRSPSRRSARSSGSTIRVSRLPGAACRDAGKAGGSLTRRVPCPVCPQGFRGRVRSFSDTAGAGCGHWGQCEPGP